MDYIEILDYMGNRAFEYIEVIRSSYADAIEDSSIEGVDSSRSTTKQEMVLGKINNILRHFDNPSKNYLLSNVDTITRLASDIFGETSTTEFVLGLRFHSFIGLTREDLSHFIEELAFSLSSGLYSPEVEKMVGSSIGNPIEYASNPDIDILPSDIKVILLRNNWLVPLIVYSSLRITYQFRINYESGNQEK